LLFLYDGQFNKLFTDNFIIQIKKYNRFGFLFLILDIPFPLIDLVYKAKDDTPAFIRVDRCDSLGSLSS